MRRTLVVATGGAGGDLQPLLAVALALRDRGDFVSLVGDRSVVRVTAELGVDVDVLPAGLDLGPRLITVIRDAMAAADGDLAAAGPLVEDGLAQWAADVAEPTRAAIRRACPDVVLTSLFGVEAVALAEPTAPWVVVNSTFYVGPNPPRPIELDIGARAVPLIARYARLLDRPDLVLHATDDVFDLAFDSLPDRHHYTGPLGIWEPPGLVPDYLEEPGDPWVLVSISSQLQDDVPLAEMAVSVLAERPVRVVVTLGPSHDPQVITDPPPNVHVERTVSHNAVLGHARLLLSHAGHGSVMKALWHGTPMVLVPWGRDQPGVAVRAAALGVAAVVPRADATVDTLASAIDRVLADARIRHQCVQQSARLRATDPVGCAVRLIKALLTEGSG